MSTHPKMVIVNTNEPLKFSKAQKCPATPKMVFTNSNKTLKLLTA